MGAGPDAYSRWAGDVGGAPFDATAFDVFAGYVVLDAWVANRDRHDNNWAVLRPITLSADPLRLCGSYDHASSLGFNVTDEERSVRLADRGKVSYFDLKKSEG
jgi:hypothetical protein